MISERNIEEVDLHCPICQEHCDRTREAGTATMEKFKVRCDNRGCDVIDWSVRVKKRVSVL